MREIKFRGKTTYDNRWVYGSYFYTDDNKNNPFGTTPIKEKHCILFYERGDWNMGGWNWEEVDRNTVSQFTNLYDKNGKEIYEGDILVFDESYGESKILSNYTLEVRYVRGIFAFLWDGNLYDECTINSPTREWAVVVGNIYDNPELIKTDDE